MKKLYTFLFLSLFSMAVMAATTGKISGVITDGETGEPLIGVNVIISELGIGAATDISGFYAILNIPPGSYDLAANYIGYTSLTYSDVRVRIDLTTTQNFSMNTFALEGEAVIIEATKPIVDKDIASSQRNISSDEFVDMPINSIAGVVGLQAGVEGLSIRSGGEDEMVLMMDGITLKDDRTGKPVTGIPLSSVKEVMVQSGGFNAEYSDLQSGLINVVTREGRKDSYSFSISYRHSPAAPKHFGTSLFSEDSYFLKPYFDDEVAWTGTEREPFDDLNGNDQWDPGETFDDKNGDAIWAAGWDNYTQDRSPSFKGWNGVAVQMQKDGINITPEGAKRLFEWQVRREGNIVEPDYSIDMGFGGPVPLVGKALGNLRFFASYNGNQNMYMVPMSRDAYRNWVGTIRLTSDITPKIKLSINGFAKEITASSSSGSGQPTYFSSIWGIAGVFGSNSQQSWKLLSPEYYTLTTINTNMISAKLTGIVDSKSFYEGIIEYSETSYDSNPNDRRLLEPTAPSAPHPPDVLASEYDSLYTIYLDDYNEFTADSNQYIADYLAWDNSLVDIFPGAEEFITDQAPFGFVDEISVSVGGIFDMGLKSNSRDTSKTSRFKAKFDYTNQINRYNQVKTGIQYEYFDYNMNYGAINPILPSGRPFSTWHRSPYQVGLYLQDKLEFDGWIASIGLRAEYFDPNTDWYDVDPYDAQFFSSNYTTDIEDEIPTRPAETSLTFLPRVGISHPITVNSKIYFNYGHMRQKFSPDNLFGVRRVTGGEMSLYGDPELPMEKTVAFEMGYDHALFNSYLIHLSGYYKDKSDQSSTVSYNSVDGTVGYSKYENIFYQDIRGFELELRKMRGDWITGFANYTYAIYSSGRFGVRNFYQNPAEQRIEEANYARQTQYKPLPRPRANFNLNFHTPDHFGPTIAGDKLFGDWHASFTGFWKAGSYATYGRVGGIVNNVRWKDSYNVNGKLSKTYHMGNVNVTFLAEAFNFFNFKHFGTAGTGTAIGWINYEESLHFAEAVYEELGFKHLSGDDRYGDYRKDGVDYQPMDFINAAYDDDGVAYSQAEGTYYWVEEESKYMSYSTADSDWTTVDDATVQKVLDDKAYIDNPPNESLTFLNPRDIFMGIKLSYNF